jgi:hypothetical protein
MNDQLEDFVRHNRSAFDDKQPSPGVWKGIERSLDLSKNVWWNAVPFWRAAAILFMATSLYLVIPNESSQKENAVAMKEFTDVESFYNQQISHKVELIDEFKSNEGVNGFTHDFQQLEAMYLVLKEEMKTSPSEKVKDALVLNLLIRIDLLNKHLHNLEKQVKPTQEDRGV